MTSYTGRLYLPPRPWGGNWTHVLTPYNNTLWIFSIWVLTENLAGNSPEPACSGINSLCTNGGRAEEAFRHGTGWGTLDEALHSLWCFMWLKGRSEEDSANMASYWTGHGKNLCTHMAHLLDCSTASPNCYWLITQLQVASSPLGLLWPVACIHQCAYFSTPTQSRLPDFSDPKFCYLAWHQKFGKAPLSHQIS